MSKFKKIFLLGLFSLVTTCVQASTGGFQLDRSRVLFEDGKKSVNYGITNHYAQPALASAMVTNFDGSPTSAFAVSPSLFQIRPQTTSQGQIVLLENLPQDRETVFWLNVKTILAKENKNKEQSSVELAIAQRIKLFYRPKGLDEKCSGAVENLIWEKTKTGLKANNPSKVSVSIVNVKKGDDVQRIGDTLMPLSEKEWKVEGKDWQTFVLTYVDEYGNVIEQPVSLK